MSPVFAKLYRLLDAQDRRRAIMVLVLMLLTAVSEVLGVASIMPFMAVLADPTVIQSNRYLALLSSASGLQSERSFLFALGVAFFLVLVGSLALQGIGAWAQLRFSQNRTVALSSRLVGAYLRQPYAWFLNKHSADLATAILNEVDTVVNSALVPAMQVLAQGLVALSLVLLLFTVDPVLATTVAVVLGGGFGAIAVASRQRMRRVSQARYEQNRARFHAVQEAFGGIKEVKIGGLEREMLQRFVRPSRRRARHQIEAGLVMQISPLLMQAVLFGGLLLVVLYLLQSYNSLQRALPIIGLYALAGYRLMPAMQKVFSEHTKLRANESAIDSLAVDLALIGVQPLPIASEEVVATAPIGLRHALTLSNLTFRYPESERQAIDGMSLVIPAHQSIGLVGATGSGKSTLVDIIMGLLTPDSGEILVDGVPLTQASLQSWQRSIGYVPQQIYLSDGTIAENIAFGVPTNAIDQLAVEKAARVACLHDFIRDELPEGYQTSVGERGVRLSGGQRQRIGIARALYHDPDVLVLDEATSALDNLTEHAVMEAVRNLARRKTIIMIAHRLVTVRECDCIFMLQNGTVVARGLYSALITENEQFQELAGIEARGATAQ